MVMFTRRHFLATGTAALAAGIWASERRAKAGGQQPPRNLILVVASGGWDTTYALDPKPGLPGIDVPGGTIQEFGSLAIYTDPSRPNVSAFFEAHAPLCAVINGIQVQSVVHNDCYKRILTGTASDTNPDIGAITAYELGRDLPVPYLVLGQTSYAGPYASIAARTGTANQIGTLLDPNAAFPVPDGQGGALPRFIPSGNEDEMIRAYVMARAEREKAVRGQSGSNAKRIRDFIETYDRGDALATLGSFGDLEYTRDLAVASNLAVNALEQSLSQVVQVEMGDWDTHENNARQAVQHEGFYGALKGLVDDLVARPGKTAGKRMIDETVVAVVSEMGRTPKLNENAGKDHWPMTSALVIGGGVAGGRVYGRTNDLLEGEAIDMQTGEPDPDGITLQYGNLAAGLLQVAGADPSLHLPNSEPLHAICA